MSWQGTCSFCCGESQFSHSTHAAYLLEGFLLHKAFSWFHWLRGKLYIWAFLSAECGSVIQNICSGYGRCFHWRCFLSMGFGPAGTHYASLGTLNWFSSLLLRIAVHKLFGKPSSFGWLPPSFLLHLPRHKSARASKRSRRKALILSLR